MPSDHNSINLNPTSDLVIYPKSSDIGMNAADMRIMLRDFKEAIKNELTLPVILAILSLWVPLVTSDFRGFFGVGSDQIKAGYIVFSTIVTISLVKPFLFSVAILLSKLFSFFLPKSRLSHSLEKFETDPDKKVEQILAVCNIPPERNVFSVLEAKYGAEGKIVDVTSELNKCIKNGRLETKATNALAPDPAPGIPKYLDIRYSANGMEHTKRFNENEDVVLP